MTLKHLTFIVLLITTSTTKLLAQHFLGDNILILEPHHSEDSKFYAKFLDNKTLKILENWEMRSYVEEINEENFNELVKKQLIFPDGVSYKFYPKMKLKSVSHYQVGKQVGIEKGFYKDRKLKYKADHNDARNVIIEYFHKNGEVIKIENYSNGFLFGEVKEFYENGKKKSIADYEKGKMNGKYQSFYRNGKTRRKAKFENNVEVLAKCFDIDGETITNTPFLIPTSHPEGFDALINEIEKLDLSFNKANTDTSDFRIILDIDTLGNPILANYHFEHADTLQAMLQEWGNSLPKFSPAIIDGQVQPSYLNMAVTVCSDKFICFGDATLNYSFYNLNSDIEKRHTWFWEFPNPTNNQVFFITENMPQFPGGEKNLRKYISNNTKYPTEAREKRIQGKVYVNFIVEKDGSVSNEKVIRSVHPLLDDEALRVIKSVPDFMPGTQRGLPVRVSYSVPVNFALSHSNPLKATYKTETIQIRR